MRVQANLPDTLPGQNVTFLLFGDVELADESAGDEALLGTAPLEHFIQQPSNKGRHSHTSRIVSGLPAHPLSNSYRGMCLPLQPDDIDEQFRDTSKTKQGIIPTCHIQPYPLSIFNDVDMDKQAQSDLAIIAGKALRRDPAEPERF
jgi:hypothetical protein